MKKFLLLFVFATLIISCSDDEDTPSFNYDMESLYGKWRVTHIQRSTGAYFDITTSVAEQTFEPTYATFNSDGSYTGEGYFGDGTGTYKAVENTITTYVDGSEYIKYDVVSFSDTTATLTMSMTGSDSELNIKVKKQ